MIDLIYENSDLVVVNKPQGLATAPLKGRGGDCLFNRVAEVYPEIKNVKGYHEWEGGLLHRLDSNTSGLVLLARNQRAFDNLYSQQKKGGITKIYRAEVCSYRTAPEGFPPFTFGDIKGGAIVSSAFRSYGARGVAVRPLAVSSLKSEQTVYSTDVIPFGLDSFLCTIVNGFRHQIRAHLAWAGYPIKGDTLYGGDEAEVFGLCAVSLSFINPSDGAKLDLTLS